MTFLEFCFYFNTFYFYINYYYYFTILELCWDLGQSTYKTYDLMNHQFLFYKQRLILKHIKKLYFFSKL